MMLDLLAAANSGFDVEAATRAYLDTLQGPARAQSDAYFTGGYWLILWGAVIAVLSDWLLLRFRIASGLRAWLESRIGGWRAVTWATALAYTLLGFLFTLPWTIYTGFFRERQYGLMNQSFGDWFGQQLTGLAISLVFVPLIALAVYATIRRAPRRWWMWATGVMGVFLLIGVVLGPVFIAPLFNSYTELPAGPLRTRILDMAARQNIPASHIYVFDQSKQDKRISANVSGLGPTIRISLNDNLLKRTSEDEVVAVLGHEMGPLQIEPHLDWFRVLLRAGGLRAVPDQPNRAVADSPLWRALGRARPGRSGVAAGAGDLPDGLLFPRDPADQHRDAHRREPGRRLRPRCGAAARCRGQGGHAPVRISQDRAGAARGGAVLRSSQRRDAGADGDGVEEGACPERADRGARARVSRREMTDSLLIFGLGYSARAIAATLEAQGWRIEATGSAGTIDFGDTLAVRAALDQASHVLSSVPPGEEGDPVLTRYGDVLGGKWLGYLSATGVYGDTGGAWVDESSPVGSGRRTARTEADARWLALGARVFRLPGIYGLGRSPLDRVRAGTAHQIDLPAQVFSRVHVEDIASGVAAALEAEVPPGSYNLADDEPASQNAVVELACRLLGVPPPPLQWLDEAELSPMARGFYAENRRVANGKLKRAAGWAPRYPSYREGLVSLL